MKFCPKCGAAVKEEAKFCQSCGHALKYKASDEVKADAPKAVDETEINEPKTLDEAQANEPEVDTSKNLHETKINESETSYETKIDEHENSDKTEETYTSNYNEEDTKPDFKQNPKTKSYNKILIAGIIVICIIIGAFVCVGKIISDPTKVVASFQNAAAKNDADALSKTLYTSDERMNLTSKDVAPLLQSFKTTPSEFSDIISSLNTQAESIKNGGSENQTSNLYVTKVGSTLLFFPKYRIGIKPTYITITSNIEGADILVNGKEIAKTDSKSFSKQVGPYIPGTYSIVAKASGNFGDMHNETKVDFLNSKNQSDTVSALKGIYLQVSSNYSNNEVYINGKDTGKSINSGDTIGPVAVGSNIYAMVDYNGTKIKSSYDNVSDSDDTINFDYSKQEDTVQQQKNDIGNMITGYGYALANALSYGNSTSLASYMYPGSKLYNQQMANVKSYSTSKNGFYEQYDSAVVNSYTMNPDGKSGTVDSTEVYDINENANDYTSQTKTRTFENIYKFQYNDTTQSYQLTERTSAVEK